MSWDDEKHIPRPASVHHDVGPALKSHHAAQASVYDDVGGLKPSSRAASSTTMDLLLIDDSAMSSGARVSSSSSVAFRHQHHQPRRMAFGQKLLFWFRAPLRLKKALLVESWRKTWRDVVHDFKVVRWGRGGLWVLFLCWAGGLLTADILIPLLATRESPSGSACQADGSFDVVTRYSAWDLDDFFQITAGFGHLSFAQAKMVDVAWDVVIGRLGQTILVLFSWKAFSLHIMASMNRQVPVTYDTFWTFFMSHEVSFGTIWACIRDFATGRSLRSKTVRLFIVLTMVFVMAWPTLASAMTGYNSNNTAFFKAADGTFVAFSALQPVLYVVHDGSRVGLGDDYVVPYCAEFHSGHDPVAGPSGNFGYCASRNNSLQHHVSDYVQAYGFYALNNTKSVWNHTGATLSAPVLNISAFYLDNHNEYDEASQEYSAYYGRMWEDPRTNTKPFHNWSNITYAYGNATYDRKYLVEDDNGICQPDGTYMWGFSFLQAFTSLLLTTLWTAAISALWLRSHLELSGHQRGKGYEVPTPYQAAVRLGRSIDRDFGHVDACDLRSAVFLNHLNRGGRMRGGEEASAAQSTYSMRTSIKQWVVRERWWLVALAVHAVWGGVGWLLPAVSVYSSMLYLLLVATWPSLVIAMVLGSTTRSRIFFITMWALLGAIAIMSCILPYYLL